jgi:hypothetical protein
VLAVKLALRVSFLQATAAAAELPIAIHCDVESGSGFPCDGVAR